MSEFTPNFFRRSIILVGALRSIILALTCIHNWRSMKKKSNPKMSANTSKTPWILRCFLSNWPSPWRFTPGRYPMGWASKLRNHPGDSGDFIGFSWVFHGFFIPFPAKPWVISDIGRVIPSTETSQRRFTSCRSCVFSTSAAVSSSRSSERLHGTSRMEPKRDGDGFLGKMDETLKTHGI